MNRIVRISMNRSGDVKRERKKKKKSINILVTLEAPVNPHATSIASRTHSQDAKRERNTSEGRANGCLSQSSQDFRIRLHLTKRILYSAHHVSR